MRHGHDEQFLIGGPKDDGVWETSHDNPTRAAEIPRVSVGTGCRRGDRPPDLGSEAAGPFSALPIVPAISVAGFLGGLWIDPDPK
jgi:hypothetical protein